MDVAKNSAPHTVLVALFYAASNRFFCTLSPALISDYVMYVLYTVCSIWSRLLVGPSYQKWTKNVPLCLKCVELIGRFCMAKINKPLIKQTSALTKVPL